MSQDFLVRPMGIFQLIDYVGLDVCQCILAVMDPRTDRARTSTARSSTACSTGASGAGSITTDRRRTGSSSTSRASRSASTIRPRKRYVPIGGFQAACDARLGPLPEPALPWKVAVRDPAKDARLAAFFGQLKAMETPGAELALRYGARSRDIGLQLVSDGVARNAADVNTGAADRLLPRLRSDQRVLRVMSV